MKFDIITFGSATRDAFFGLKEGDYHIAGEGVFEKKDICFPLGSKIFVNQLEISTGGGGTNAACAFSRQGFKTAFCGKVGDDKRGEEVIKELKRFKVSTKFIRKDEKRPTTYAVVLSLPRGERTILIFKGACYFMERKDIKLPSRLSRWFYVAPLNWESSNIFGEIVKFARKNEIKIAANLGRTQINLPREILNPILKHIDLLTLNKEEASLLANIPLGEEEKMLKKIKALTKGIVVLTKGEEGALASDGKYIFRSFAHNVLPIDRTGAGDAFGSGFLSGLLEKNDIEYAIQLATANAASCIGKIGAKNGLLGKGEWKNWSKVKVEKSLL